jgi:hypothetical protein
VNRAFRERYRDLLAMALSGVPPEQVLQVQSRMSVEELRSACFHHPFGPCNAAVTCCVLFLG